MAIVHQSMLFALIALLLMELLPVNSAHSAELRQIEPGQTHFTEGTYKLEEALVFSSPVIFDEGAVMNIAKGVTVTFKDSFTAGNGQVFSGEGKVAGLHKLTPEWFGAKGDGTTDDTAGFQKALDSFPDLTFSEKAHEGRYVLLLRNSYRLSSVSVNTTLVNIQSENAWLIAMDTGSYPYLIRFTRNFCSISGYLNIEGNYNLGYESMVNISNARHFCSHNVHIFRANLGWRFGTPDYGLTNDSPGMSEKGDSEIEIIGGATAHCLRGVEAIGSNTIVTFTGAIIYSYPWTLPEGDPRKSAWESADATLIRSYGAYIYFTGGQLANFSPSTPMVEVQPLRNTMPEYYSYYGGVYISNTHIESGNFFRTANPKEIRQQDYKGVPLDPAKNVALWMIGCGGYVTGKQIPVETDPIFTGSLIFSDCNFYGVDKADTFAKIGNSRATIKVDDVTLRNKWSNGLSAIDGGAPIFGNRTILEARLLQDKTVSGDSYQILFSKFVENENTGHFRNSYDPQTGIFTVPEVGLDQVTVTANISLSEPANAGQLRLSLLKNEKEVFATTSTGPSGSLSFKFAKLSPGDRLAIAARTVSGTRQIIAGEGTVFMIEASRF